MGGGGWGEGEVCNCTSQHYISSLGHPNRMCVGGGGGGGGSGEGVSFLGYIVITLNFVSAGVVLQPPLKA